MGAKLKLRLHYPDGSVVVETMAKAAAQNGTNMRGMRLLVARWVKAGDLVERRDGGFDVIRYQPRRRP
jgi:hypothetical protein